LLSFRPRESREIRERTRHCNPDFPWGNVSGTVECATIRAVRLDGKADSPGGEPGDLPETNPYQNGLRGIRLERIMTFRISRITDRKYTVTFLVLSILIVFTAVVVPGCSRTENKAVVSGSARIISFAPSITETLFALSLGNRVVGVTRYCTYPPEVGKCARIGGYLDPNYEMIMSLKPDLVILLKEHTTLLDFLNKQGIRYLSINNENVNGILESFSLIANACGVKARGDSLAQIVRSVLIPDSIPIHPKVLMCIGRDNPGTGSISKVYIAGRKSFYNELLETAGGENAFADSSPAYPSMSSEGVIRCAPDIIIDMMAPVSNVDQDKMTADWNSLSMIKAVKTKNVYCLTGDYVTIPGPRIILIFKDLKQIVDTWREATQE